MKSKILSLLAILFFTVAGYSQETKVYIQSNDSLGKFWVYVDSVLINRSPQIQVGILGIDEKPTYSIRVVFQNHEIKPITGTIKPKKDKVRLYLLFSGTKSEIKSRRRSGIDAQPIHGDTPASHPSMPQYKGRLGCDYPMDDALVMQVVTEMTTPGFGTPMEVATRAVTTHCFTVAQIRKMVEAFEDDVERVAFCKIAWYYAYDQENFEQLEDAFTEPGQMAQVMAHVQENQ